MAGYWLYGTQQGDFRIMQVCVAQKECFVVLYENEALGTCVDFFSAEVPKVVRRTIAILEPSIICCAGVAVGFILLATLMPVFSMYASV